MSPHGYLGIEGMVVQRISEWIRASGGGRVDTAGSLIPIRILVRIS